MLERYRPAPVGTLWVDMPHVHPDVEPLGTVQDDAPEPPRAKTAERPYELKWGRERTAHPCGRDFQAVVVPARHFTPATVEQRDAERSWPNEPELQSCDTVLAVGAVLEPLVVEAEEGEGEETEGGDEEEKERAAACDAGEGPPEVGATRKRVTEKGGSEPTSRAAKRLRRRERREAIKKAEAQKKAEESTGGYCVLARGEHRAEGGVIATGDERTCLADAMSVISCMLSSCPSPHTS